MTNLYKTFSASMSSLFNPSTKRIFFPFPHQLSIIFYFILFLERINVWSFKKLIPCQLSLFLMKTCILISNVLSLFTHNMNVLSHKDHCNRMKSLLAKMNLYIQQKNWQPTRKLFLWHIT